VADTFGALSLPAGVPGTDDGDGLTTAAAGDPCLDVLGAFFSAVLIADVGDAWDERAPASDEQPIVRAVFTHDPIEVEFKEFLCPALYLWRSGEGAGVDEYAEDLLRDSASLRLWWVMPHVPDPDVHRQRAAFLNAVGKAIARACNAGRHPAWVTAADATADADAVRLASTNTQASVTWSGAGLNGATGGGTVNASRHVTVTTTASAGAFNIADPILVTGLLDSGASFTESIYLTAVNGGQTIEGIWRFTAITSVTRPGQTLAAGSVSVGFAASPEATLGSLVKRAAGLSRLHVPAPAKPKKFDIENEAAERIGPFYAVEMAIAIEEIEQDDPVQQVADGLLVDISAGTYGAQLTVTNEQGETMSVGDLPNT
jgi:hypothetical protein